MADLMWRVGAFAERFPQAAMEIGRAHALHARAAAKLHDTAGTATESSFAYQPFPGDCCGADCGEAAASTEQPTCCSRGTCCGCGPTDEDVEAIFPAVTAIIDEGHALEAAQRDILSDPDVEDVAAAMSQAQDLARKAKLAAYYVPASQAKPMPDGSEAPMKCPICGCTPCPACGCCCECCDSAVEAEEPAGEAE